MDVIQDLLRPLVVWALKQPAPLVYALATIFAAAMVATYCLDLANKYLEVREKIRQRRAPLEPHAALNTRTESSQARETSPPSNQVAQPPEGSTLASIAIPPTSRDMPAGAAAVQGPAQTWTYAGIAFTVADDAESITYTAKVPLDLGIVYSLIAWCAHSLATTLIPFLPRLAVALLAWLTVCSAGILVIALVRGEGLTLLLTLVYVVMPGLIVALGVLAKSAKTGRSLAVSVVLKTAAALVPLVIFVLVLSNLHR